MISTSNLLKPATGYAEVNGLKMYYEIYGQGDPLVLLHGGGSTIQTSFGRIIPLLATSRKLICVELQAHGRTNDRRIGISFEQDADDVAALLDHLEIRKADVLGFSNGGTTAIQMAIRHPEKCRHIISASPLLKRDGVPEAFWNFMRTGTLEQMPRQYKDAYLAVQPDSVLLQNMFNRCADRMINFKDIPDDQIKNIQHRVLLVNGDRDVATSEHIVAMSRLIPNSHICILPGGHGEYMGEITTLREGSNDFSGFVHIIEGFLTTK